MCGNRLLNSSRFEIMHRTYATLHVARLIWASPSSGIHIRDDEKNLRVECVHRALGHTYVAGVFDNHYFVSQRCGGACCPFV